MRVVVDTGVWVSALISTTGAPTHVVAAMLAGHIDVITAPRGLEELSAVVTRDKFRRWFSLEQAESFVTQLARWAQLYPDIDSPSKQPETEMTII